MGGVGVRAVQHPAECGAAGACRAVRAAGAGRQAARLRARAASFLTRQRGAEGCEGGVERVGQRGGVHQHLACQRKVQALVWGAGGAPAEADKHGVAAAARPAGVEAQPALRGGVLGADVEGHSLARPQAELVQLLHRLPAQLPGVGQVGAAVVAAVPCSSGGGGGGGGRSAQAGARGGARREPEAACRGCMPPLPLLCSLFAPCCPLPAALPAGAPGALLTHEAPAVGIPAGGAGAGGGGAGRGSLRVGTTPAGPLQAPPSQAGRCTQRPCIQSAARRTHSSKLPSGV